MDRNSAIGLTLIAAILMVYFYWFAPAPQPPTPETTRTETSSGQVVEEAPTRTQVLSDSALRSSFGDLSTAMQGEGKNTFVETEDLKVAFSSHGGIISELELKKYRTYNQEPLKLVTPQTNKFSLLANYGGKEVDLYKLYYTAEQSRVGDSTRLTYSASVGEGVSISHTYIVPDKGFEIRYILNSKGFDRQLSNEPLTFQWNNTIPLMEKDIADTRNNTTITYYTADESFDELSPRAGGTETEVFTAPVKWISIKQKFFLSALIATHNFASGEIQTIVNENEPTIVKQANVKLSIAKEQLAGNTADFKYYFGPNDYKVIGKVTDKFAKNVYLGWPPVYWINKFVIFPVFHFLTKIIDNYGLIIIILVILLKLVLFPLSYKSYLSMAKMKVLKPELDEIKERTGDDMAKAQQEQMKLYQQVGVNPISGCIPVLLQMPILFAMFYLFPASIELRQQPLLWAEDLSTYDSVIRFGFALPILGSHISLFTVLMTLSTLIYTWQNNQISSVQGPMKSMSYIMPIIFFFVLNSFSAGLTFYYLVSNLVTFAQQAIIKKFVDENKIRALMEENRKRIAAGGGGKKSKFMSKLEEAMKVSEEARKKSGDERKRRKDR